MDQELLSANILLTMKFITAKYQPPHPKKPFLHADIVLEHFAECMNMFANNRQIYKALLSYYQQNCVVEERGRFESSEGRVFVGQLLKENQVAINVCQAILHLLIVGLNSLIAKDIQKPLSKHIKQLYNDLKIQLILEDQSPTDILKPYLLKLIQLIKNYQFYQNLLQIFKDIDNFSLIALLEKTIADFRLEWNKNQNELKQSLNYKNPKRQNALVSEPKATVSLQKNHQNKENKSIEPDNRLLNKTAEKGSEPKSALKSIKMKPKPVVTRQSSYTGSKFKFNPRATMSNFGVGQQKGILIRPLTEEKIKLELSKRPQQQKMEPIDEDCICEGTPEKFKKKR